MTESTQEKPTAGVPELCRVSIIGGNTQVDLSLPARVPIIAMIDDIAGLISSHTPAYADDEQAPAVSRHLTLARIGRPPIAPESTLAEARIRDGHLLMLCDVGARATPALFDDVIDAVARLTESTFRGWSAVAARWVAVAAALLGTPGAVLLLVLAKNHGNAVAAGAIAVGTGLTALVTAAIVARKYPQPMIAAVLSLCAVLLLGPGVALFLPTRFGSPHTLLACAICLLLAPLAYRLTGVGATMIAAVMTIAVFGAAAAAATVLWHHPLDKIGAAVLAVALTAISASARLAAAVSRLPVPPVPTAGGRVDPADHEPRPTLQGIGAVGATALPSAAGLAERVRVANEYQSGILIGTTAAAALGAMAAANCWSAQPHWQGVLLAAVAGLVLCLRARAFADLTQAATLIMGGILTLAVLAAGLGIGHPGALLPCAGALLTLVALILAVGAGGQGMDPSPVLRRAGELAEYALIIAIVPLVLWTMDLYALARSI
ncbi:type VII secretion integral membrane protein EccD [Nocardia alni]|uniref:type VII secretion integral membrane protein EccD n=1 Tax=Nocardia alni TaxID=2815723 RepID=UPI001C23E4D0|nr:type VII secretion integral membrane protein EccD [Nocardia alni]